ncbi:MAG: CPBP family intramembrane metalloprotease [Planctomycetaceae bacterium]|nr:CPBP family intramembrane metalloprotease [Planctomycetaceae bacterium]
MNWRNVRLIFLREVRDQLRDRRTLFMIAVLPLILYPGLGVGMMQMTVLFSEQPRTVVVLGAKELPLPQLLDGDRFVANWFDEPAKAERLRVVTEDALDENDSGSYQELADLLAAAASVREAHREYERLAEEREQAISRGDEREAHRVAAHLEAAGRRRSQLFSSSGIQVLIVVPSGMREKLAEANGLIRERDIAAGEVEIPKPVVLYNVADEKSLVAYTRVRHVLDAWETQLLKDRLRMANLPEALPTQVEPETIDLARAEERSRSLWSKLFPALLIIMTVTGAFYPAVDLAAGEKERGTMETLLICPASRSEIVFGKFLTVMLFSVCTALLNLMSMGFTGKYMASFVLGGAMSKAGSLAPPPLAALAWVVILLVPLAALFSALCLALATFARSSKEGQYYLTPILLVTVGLTVFCLSPAVEITPLYSVLPVLGISLLLKELLAGGGAYMYLVPVLVASFGYAALALWWAVEQFSREDVLFREAERFELKLWLRHLLRDKGQTPSFAEAGFCFVLIMLLQFGAMKVFAEAAAAGPLTDFGGRTLQLLMIQQLVIVATPALLMGVMLTSSIRKTFRLRWPGLRFMAVGAILPLALMPLSVTLAEHLGWFFPPLPDSIQQTLKLMNTDSVPLWLALVAFAVAPAFCEEIAFRGFILSGFLHSRRTWLAIGLSSVAFGVMHMIPQQVFNAALLGLVLGLLAVRSNSLWPGVLFHVLFNGSHVAIGRLAPSVAEDGYSWPLLVVCATVSAALIHWLVVTGRPRPKASSEDAREAVFREEEIPLHVG